MKKKRKLFEEENSKLKMAEDVIKSLIQWVLVSACGFAYWMLVLLILSMFLMNIWITTFEKILRYGIILSVITSIVYAGILIRRKLK